MAATEPAERVAEWYVKIERQRLIDRQRPQPLAIFCRLYARVKVRRRRVTCIAWHGYRQQS